MSRLETRLKAETARFTRNLLFIVMSSSSEELKMTMRRAKHMEAKIEGLKKARAARWGKTRKENGERAKQKV